MSRLGRLPRESEPSDPAAELVAPSSRWLSPKLALAACGLVAVGGAAMYLDGQRDNKEKCLALTNLAVQYSRERQKTVLKDYPEILQVFMRQLLPPSSRTSASSGVVEIIEFVRLPRGSTHSCHELNLPVKGEVRLHTNFAAAQKVKVRINTKATRRTGSLTASLSSSAGPGATQRVKLDNVSLSELVDRSAFAANSELSLIPGNVQTNYLLSYESTSLDSLLPAVTIKDCALNPASGPQTYNLSFVLCAYAVARAVSVDMILPKGAVVVEAAHQGVGHWGRFSESVASELHWDVGNMAMDAPPPQPEQTSPRIHPEEIVRFSLTYFLPHQQQEDEILEPITASMDVPNPLVPAVTLSYQSPDSASGLRLRKFIAEPLAADTPGVGKVESSAVYRTCFSQEITVDSSL